MSKKVLMFGWEFPPLNSGGLGVACKGLAEALVKKGVEVVFVLPKKVDITNPFVSFKFANISSGQKIKQYEIPSNIQSPYKTSDSVMGHLNIENFNIEKQYSFDIAGEVLMYEAHASEVVENETFDVIHAHDWLSYGAGLVAKKISGKPLIAHIHATEIDRTGGNGVNQFVFDLEKRGFEEADAVIAVSELTRQTIIQYYGINPEKIKVVHNGMKHDEINHNEVNKIDVLNEAKRAGYNVVLFLGRLTIQKNPKSLLLAAKSVIQYHPKSLFVFAGSGDMERELIETAAELGISDKVIFAGFIRGAEKHRLFSIADLFVMPSISEPFGLVSLEALANNTPVLISKQSGVSEVLLHSLQVDFWDLDEIINKIVAVLMHTSLKEVLATNGHVESKSITWDVAAGKVIEIYNQSL